MNVAEIHRSIQAALDREDVFTCFRLCERALSFDPNDDIARRLMALAHLRAGEPEQAEAILLDIQRLRPTAETIFELFKLYFWVGEIPRAKACLADGVSRFPEVPTLADWLAKISSEPFFDSIQGGHAPERQTYMSTLAFLKRGGSGALKILEIGSYMGGSAYTWSRAASRLAQRPAEIFCVDPWEGAQLSQYNSDMSRNLKTGRAFRMFMNAIRHFPDSTRVHPIVGTLPEKAEELSAHRFDIIYIDGSHLYENVLKDLSLSVPLLADGGFLCGDDLELQAAEIDLDAARLNLASDYVQDPRTGLWFHPGVTLAIAEVFGRVSAYRGFWVMQRNGDDLVEVDLSGATGLLPTHFPVEYVQLAKDRLLQDGVLSEMLD